MARIAGGKEVLLKAKTLLSKAKTADEMRHAQAVILPLEFGYSLDHTAQIIGVSKGYAGRLRSAFIRHGGVQKAQSHGGRRRQNMTHQEETDFLTPFFEKAAIGGILIVSEIKEALDERLGRRTALASVYNLLHRHGWRKLAPDKRHPKADILAQQTWKKNPRRSSQRSHTGGKKKDP